MTMKLMFNPIINFQNIKDMKKIFAFIAAAAICCPAFVSCDKDNGGNGEETGTPEYLDDVTADAASITFTVNSTGEYGYKYAIISQTYYEIILPMNEGEDVTAEEAQQLTFAQFLMGDTVMTTVEPITVTVDSPYYGMGEGMDITPETMYYIVAVDLDAEGNFENSNIKFVTVTTAAAAEAEPAE